MVTQTYSCISCTYSHHSSRGFMKTLNQWIYLGFYTKKNISLLTIYSQKTGIFAWPQVCILTLIICRYDINLSFTYFWDLINVSFSFSLFLNFLIILLLCNCCLDSFSPENNVQNTNTKLAGYYSPEFQNLEKTGFENPYFSSPFEPWIQNVNVLCFIVYFAVKSSLSWHNILQIDIID
jgi:hypothetical protein